MVFLFAMLIQTYVRADPALLTVVITIQPAYCTGEKITGTVTVTGNVTGDIGFILDAEGCRKTKAEGTGGKGRCGDTFAFTVPTNTLDSGQVKIDVVAYGIGIAGGAVGSAQKTTDLIEVHKSKLKVFHDEDNLEHSVKVSGKVTPGNGTVRLSLVWGTVSPHPDNKPEVEVAAGKKCETIDWQIVDLIFRGTPKKQTLQVGGFYFHLGVPCPIPKLQHPK